jgi:2-iminobutanoate/2-iminopropanoate deaminase
MLHAISPENLFPPSGHYVPAIRHAGMVHVSATLATTFATTAGAGHALVSAPFETQMRQALANCSEILHAAGSSLQRVISLIVYVTDLSDWEVLDRVVAELFDTHRPSRSVVCVSHIRYGYAVQVSLSAAV